MQAKKGLDKEKAIGYTISCVYGMWHSLVARFVRDEEAAGSNPVIPTIEKLSQQLRLLAFLYLLLRPT